jgi:saccharopine dehydrogenase-like NADP-dependent oxidoreductase
VPHTSSQSTQVNYRITILGGYGNFGARVSRTLATEPNIQLVVAGRDAGSASSFVRTLGRAAAEVEATALDHTAPDFPAELRALRPNLVIHTSGPFQGQDYHVARAAIDAGAHYVDLADGRAFVVGITVLDAAARERGVVVAAGASTLPAVSSAMVDSLVPAFSRMDSIDICIAPGQKTPRGRATMEAILSYCGRPFLELNDSTWRRVYGWQGLRRWRHPDLGTRWAARCDVPDLELLPAWYPTLRSARFDASLEFAVSHLGLWKLAWLVRAGVIRRPEAFADAVLRYAQKLDRWGTDVGGMTVRVAGVGIDDKPLQREWCLTAGSGHGPEIPCIPAIVIARKLARGESIAPGARPCGGMMTLAEFDLAVRDLDIRWRVQ